jgi:hypothetical protein
MPVLCLSLCPWKFSRRVRLASLPSRPSSARRPCLAISVLWPRYTTPNGVVDHIEKILTRCAVYEFSCTSRTACCPVPCNNMVKVLLKELRLERQSLNWGKVRLHHRHNPLRNNSLRIPRQYVFRLKDSTICCASI